MPHITRALLRKRAEHNEGMISTLEEISLHQEELESISECLGTTCRKLKILYLQNNIIPRMENLHHMKDLEYLNLALNNVAKIEGLHQCEFLQKLDMTVNFVDFDHLEESITHLTSRHNLRDLFMMGNPSQMEWGDQADCNFENYCIHRLPQLTSLDGKDITKSARIVAAQHFPRLEAELRVKAVECVAKKAAQAVALREANMAKAARKASKAAAKAKVAEDKAAAKVAKEAARDAALASGEPVVEDDDGSSDDDDDNGIPKGDESEEESCPHTPENRVEMYREMAEEKAEKEAREASRQPRKRDYEAEQAAAIERVRKAEEEGKVRQCNDGKWPFFFDEASKKGFVLLDVDVARHLDSSLIDVDVHPTYVSVVIKSKVLRLNLPAEVDATASKAQRSKTTGHLVLVMPKVNPLENALSMRVHARDAVRSAEAKASEQAAKQKARDGKHLAAQLLAAAGVELGVAPGGPKAAKPKPRVAAFDRGSDDDDLGDDDEGDEAKDGGGGGAGAGGVAAGASGGGIPPLLRRGGGVAAAAPSGGAVSIKGLVPARKGGLKEAHDPGKAFGMVAVATTARDKAQGKPPPPPAFDSTPAASAGGSGGGALPPPAESPSGWSTADSSGGGGDDDEPPELY